MANTDKPAWPQTPDGTTDWEFVFEDPQTGFIQLIAQSPSVDTLRQTTTVVIEQLFTRRGDEEAVARLKTQLETILASGAPDDIAPKRAGVSGLLRAIKDVRIEKARIYIERKHAGAAIDRRTGWLWKIDFLMKPRVLLPVGVAFILLLSGLVYALLQSTLGPTEPVIVAESPTESEPPPPAPVDEKVDEKTEDKPSEQAPSTGAGAEPSTPPKPADPADPSPDAIQPDPEPQPVRIWLKTMRWPLSAHSTTERPQYYAVVLYVEDWDTKIEVCRRVANVMDTLYQSFNHVLPQDRNARDDEIEMLEKITPNILNQAFKNTVIQKVDVVPFGDPRFKAATIPPYCKSPDKPK